MGVESTYRDHPYGSIFKNTQASGGGGGGAATPGVAVFSVNQYNTSGTGPTETPYPGATPGTEYKFTTAGYYVVTIPDASDPLTFDMWAWGGGGGTSNGPGPGRGGAGGGVRGRKTFTAPGTFTFLVGQEGQTNGTGGFPDGGSTPTSYVEGGGGGRSSIGDGTILFSARDTPTTSYFLIGGAGGGGSSYSSAGTYGGTGGYPSGTRGGAYYPSDGAVDGRGGTQSAGGAGGGSGRQGSGTAGAKYDGGAANGGAGGGGYYGGGGAGGYYAMGGGGSSYIDPLLSNIGDFDATPGPNHYLAVDDPANSTIKPATAGDTGVAGFVALKLISNGD